MNRSYKSLTQQVYETSGYKLVPIRHKDRYAIMQWRNEQIYHLRQSEPLTKEKQDWYFKNVVASLFDQEKPDQILFSFLKGDECIGYGGLVHINWLDRNAEVSFIMATEREADYFKSDWSTYLNLLYYVAYDDLELHKLFTYAFDVRPHLYPALESEGFKREAVLKEHCRFEGVYKDVIIHAKYNRQIQLREVTEADLEVTYNWATNPEVRKHSINQSSITLESHTQWFMAKLKAANCLYTIAEYNQQPVGSFRLDLIEDGTGLISYLLDPDYHGLGLGSKLLEAGVSFAKKSDQVQVIIGDVMVENQASIKSFQKMGFTRTGIKNNLIRFELKKL